MTTDPAQEPTGEPAAAPAAPALPTVSVVIATRDRPQLLREALRAVAAQDYEGAVECIVVFDQTAPDHSLADDSPTRPVRVVRNERTPGLPGARNTGILAAAADHVAFCDDDDTWRPAKVRLQVEAMRRAAERGEAAVAAVCGITIRYGDKAVDRIPRAGDLTVEALTRDRVSAAHPSTVLVDRLALLDRVGLVDEAIPGAYGEDYDWLLRAVKAGPVVAVEQPLVVVLWHPGSYFAERWQTIIDALDYLVEKHPEFRTSARGLARIQGQKAFAYAALGQSRTACRWAGRTLRLNWRERRAYLAILVAGRVLTPRLVLHLAHQRGRGI
ncbi:MAG: glycosyltransferase family 2 protein [Frankiaceae bacterium]